MPETIATADTDPRPNALNGGVGGGVGEEDVKPNVENASSSQNVNVNNAGKGSTSSSTKQHQQQSAKADVAAGQAHASPKKRRKVNHGMCCAVVGVTSQRERGDAD